MIPKTRWEKLPEAELLRRLTPPRGRIDMVLDTDTFNEVDDQFALSYCMLSPEKLNVQAIYAAPFFNENSSGPENGMERSYDEILRLLGKLGRSGEGFAFRGSRSYLPDGNTPVDSPAARDLAARAMARPDGDPLYVVAIGAITNVASALLMEPRIAQKIAVVWLGGHPTSFPTAQEFNLSQDVPAARVVFDCGAPVILVPCMGVASNLQTTLAELKACIGGKNALCDELIEIVRDCEPDHFATARVIWDVSTVAWLINPDWVPTKLTHSPLLTDDSRWAHDETRHLIREAYYCHRNPIFRDLFTKLGSLKT